MYIRPNEGIGEVDDSWKPFFKEEVVNPYANTIEDLIQIGDLIIYWQQSDQKEHCLLIVYDWEIQSAKFLPITRLLIPNGNDYKCVAIGNIKTEKINGREWLIDKGRLELPTKQNIKELYEQLLEEEEQR